MEMGTLKKALIYIAVAVAFGLVLTIIPLFILGESEAENSYGLSLKSIPNRLKDLETTRNANGTRSPMAGLEILAISFTVALVAYVLLRWRMPH
jgi:hypothetical protein